MTDLARRSARPRRLIGVTDMAAVAAAMMVPKTWRDPGSETLLAFVGASVASALAARPSPARGHDATSHQPGVSPPPYATTNV